MYKLINCKKAIFGNGKESKDTYSFLINNNKIEELGENGSFEIPKNVETINLDDHYILPGLIDAHTHLLWSGDRSREIRWKQQGFTYKEIAKKGGGIAHTVNSTRNSTDKELLQLGFERLKKALKFGTTCMEVKSGYGLSTEQE